MEISTIILNVAFVDALGRVRSTLATTWSGYRRPTLFPLRLQPYILVALRQPQITFEVTYFQTFGKA